MARTYIFDANGSSFVETSQAKRRRNKLIAFAALLAASPFMIAALVGIGLAATGGIDNPAPLNQAIEACEDAPDEFQGYCIGLYLRPAYNLDMADGASSYTPAGPALVKECFEQGLDRSELGACLTQPIG